MRRSEEELTPTSVNQIWAYPELRVQHGCRGPIEGVGRSNGAVDVVSVWLHDVLFQSSSSVFLFPPFSPCSDVVWENRGDRQHAKPRLCQEVHPGLLLWGEAEPALWRVSYSIWSGPPRTHTEAPPSSNPVLQFFFLFPPQATASPSFTSPIYLFNPPPPPPLSCLSFSLTDSLFSSLPSLVTSPALSWGIIHQCSVSIVIRWREIGIRVINISYKVLSLISLLLSKANVWNQVP